jgi:hypothetical protein
MKKGTLSLVLVLLLAFMLTGESLAEKKLRIFVDGQTVELTADIVFINNRTMVSWGSGFFEKIGGVPKYKAEDGKVWIEGEYSTVELIIGEKKAYVHRKYDFSGVPLTIEMDVAPVLIEGEAYIPLRFAAEGLDALVEWDGLNYSVIVTLKKQSGVTPLYREIGVESLPGDLIEWFNRNRLTKGFFLKIVEGNSYVLIGASERPTGGYTMELSGVYMDSAGKVTIEARVIKPSPDMMVTQALTYPCILIVMENKTVVEVEGTIDTYNFDKSQRYIVYETVNADEESLAVKSLWAAHLQGIFSATLPHIPSQTYNHHNQGRQVVYPKALSLFRPFPLISFRPALFLRIR